LNQLLKKDNYVWTVVATKTFNHLKSIMTNPPMLSLPDLNKLFIVETNAFSVGMRQYYCKRRTL
jgi:hypothetical protein